MIRPPYNKTLKSMILGRYCSNTGGSALLVRFYLCLTILIQIFTYRDIQMQILMFSYMYYIHIYKHVIDSYRCRFLQIAFIISISQYPRRCNYERRVGVKRIDVEMTWLTLEIGTRNLDTTCIHPPHPYQQLESREGKNIQRFC